MNDMRLGDLDELVIKIDELIKDAGFYRPIYEGFKNCVERSTTVDAVPVVHGRWTLNKDGSGTCNRCHFTQKNVWDMDNWQNFCGVCGARMDGE